MRTLVLLLAAAGLAVAAPAAGAAQASPWQVSLNVQSSGETLYAVDALSATDAWAGGETNASQTAFEHWNGTIWKAVKAAPVGSATYAQADGIKVLPGGEVWAVGGAEAGTFSGYQGVAEHSANGKTFTAQGLPAYSWLNAIDGTSSSNLWAGGSDQNLQPMIAHWNGTTWTTTYQLGGSSGGQILSIDAISATNVWAIGNTYTQKATRPLAVHWDGKTWTRVKLPGVGTWAIEGGIGSSSATNVWTAGWTSGDQVACVACAEMVDTLSGGAFKPRTLPAATTHEQLAGVATTGPANVWTVGSLWSANYRSLTNLLEHWNGNTWTRFGAPNVGSDDQMAAITTVPGAGNSFWAVGNSQQGGYILRCC
jgi:hypothetical protein